MAKGNREAKGRPPSLAPRTNYVTVKLSDAEKERLEEAARLLDTTKTKIIVEGIDTVHARAIAAERKRQQAEKKERQEAEDNPPADKEEEPAPDRKPVYGYGGILR